MIDELTDIVKEYEYGKHELLKESPTLKINTFRENVTISPYSIVDFNTKSGNCSDLSYALYMRLRDHFKKVFFLIASGNDPNYFTRELGENPHFFLVGSENRKILNAKSKDFSNYNFLIETTPFVLDPSLNKFTHLRNSGYKIANIEKPIKPSVNTGYWHHGISTPLSIENNEIIALHIDFHNSEILSINVPNKSATLLPEFIEENPNLKITPLIKYLNDQNPYSRKN